MSPSDAGWSALKRTSSRSSDPRPSRSSSFFDNKTICDSRPVSPFELPELGRSNDGNKNLRRRCDCKLKQSYSHSISGLGTRPVRSHLLMVIQLADARIPQLSQRIPQLRASCLFYKSASCSDCLHSLRRVIASPMQKVLCRSCPQEGLTQCDPALRQTACRPVAMP